AMTPLAAAHSTSVRLQVRQTDGCGHGWSQCGQRLLVRASPQRHWWAFTGLRLRGHHRTGHSPASWMTG
ncbi:MAG TPA: hypothetical protein VFN75_10630, partial [Pseudonocardiaceae bacterium]|nr:hypothetical protein [Pseudonocardiaceae bacterium]